MNFLFSFTEEDTLNITTLRPSWLIKLTAICGVAIALSPLILIAHFDGGYISSHATKYSFSGSFLDVYVISLVIIASLLGIPKLSLNQHAILVMIIFYIVLIVIKGVEYNRFEHSSVYACFIWLALFAMTPYLATYWLWQTSFLNGYVNHKRRLNGHGLLDEDMRRYELLEDSEGDEEKGKKALTEKVNTRYFFGLLRRRKVVEINGTSAGQVQNIGLSITDDDGVKHASFRRLARWAYVEWRMIFLATIMLIISSACSLAQPAFFGRIIAVCSSDNPRLKDINKYAVILIVIFAIGGITSCIRGWLFTLVGERLVRNIRIDLFNAIIEQDIAFFDRNKTGELANRLSSDTAVIQSCLSVNVSMGLRAVGSVVVSIIFLFVTSWELTLIMMGVVPVIVIIAIIYGRFTKRVTKEYQDSLAKANDTATECLSNIRITRCFGAEELEKKTYGNSILVSYGKGAEKAWAYGTFLGVISFLANAAILVVIYFGAVMVLHDQFDVGALTSFVLYTIYIALGLAEISGLYTEFMNALGASERIFRILDTTPAVPIKGGLWPADDDLPAVAAIPDKSNESDVGDIEDEIWKRAGSESSSVNVDNEEPDGSGKHAIQASQVFIKAIAASSPQAPMVEFDKVCFWYPMRSNVQVLKNFSLKVYSNQTVALVGSSGSGKSTVLSLLQRLYDLGEGHGAIRVQGRDVRQLDPQWLHRIMAIVPQEPILFSGTIRSNIIYSHLAANPHETITPQNEAELVESAGRQANAHDFVTSFPEGYDTLVGERGVRLSGGQKQRIAIARALYAKPKILLLDEATSALDAASEQLVQDAIDRLMQSRTCTVIVIAHRLSTVRDADIIAMCSDGEVLDAAPHEILMQRCEAYQKLVSRQLSSTNYGSNASLTSLAKGDEKEAY